MNDQESTEKWFDKGYEDGHRFATQDADYDELAAIYRADGIPETWDIFRAELLNAHLGEKAFDFGAYINGFAKACIQFYEKI